MRSDTHQRANQIDRIGASAKIPCPLLSGVGTISRNTPHLRKQKSSCVTVDWRSGQPARLPTSFLELFSCRSRKKCIVSPRQRGCNRSVGEKANRPPCQRVLQSFCRKANPPPSAKGFRPAPQEKKKKTALSLCILSGEIGGGSTEALICLGISVSVGL